MSLGLKHLKIKHLTTCLNKHVNLISELNTEDDVISGPEDGGANDDSACVLQVHIHEGLWQRFCIETRREGHVCEVDIEGEHVLLRNQGQGK